MDAEQGEVTLYVGGTVLDASGVLASPGAVAVRDRRVLAAGRADSVAAVPELSAYRVRKVDLSDRLLIPGLVNAHAHLDLTDIGPRPFTGRFDEWVSMVIAHRPADEAAVRAAVRRGAALSRAGGTAIVGDIAGHAAATAAIRSTAQELRGVSYAELFGLTGARQHEAIEFANAVAANAPPNADDRAISIGLQPHAPYSAGAALFAEVARCAAAVPVCTHLAETPQELQFVAEATGPFRDLLESLGRWDAALLNDYGHGEHPVDWWARITKAHKDARWLLAHCNYVGDAQIALLAERGASVAYCPRASDYFGHRRHRYRDMLEAGINVCLGTDSIICHSTLSIFDEMRHLYQRDRADPMTLLAMATVNGAKALRRPPDEPAAFAPGAWATLAAIRYDPTDRTAALEQVLSQRGPVAVELLEPSIPQPSSAPRSGRRITRDTPR